jgi:hypothetical protein
MKYPNLKASKSPITPGSYGGVNFEYVLNRPAEQVFAVGQGMGVDSMGALIACRNRGAKPQVITFADVGKQEEGKLVEKPQTYAYIPVLRAWLKANGFPDLVIVHKKKVRTPYDTLAENCIDNGTLPSLAFGFKGCSSKWKIVPQEQYMAKLPEVIRCWKAGYKIIKAIGYDNGPKDIRRGSKAEDDRYAYFYPLREMGWDRERCIAEIVNEGLPGWNADNEQGAPLHWVEKGGVPLKSSCSFCPAMKKWEIDRQYELGGVNREQLNEAILMEQGAKTHPTHPLKTVVGLGRNWSWEDYCREKDYDLPAIKSPRVFSLRVSQPAVDSECERICEVA